MLTTNVVSQLEAMGPGAPLWAPERRLHLLACVAVHGFNVHTHAAVEAEPGVGRGAFRVTISHGMAPILLEMRGWSRV